MKNNAPVQQLDLSINNGNTVIVDEQLINIVKKMFVPPINDKQLRIQLKDTIDNCDSIDDLFAGLEEQIYMHKVYRKLETM